MAVSGQLHAPADIPPAPIEQLAGWATEVWSFREREKPLAPAGIRKPERPSRSLVTILTELPELFCTISEDCISLCHPLPYFGSRWPSINMVTTALASHSHNLCLLNAMSLRW